MSTGRAGRTCLLTHSTRRLFACLLRVSPERSASARSRSAKQWAPRTGSVVRVHGIPPAFAGGHHCARSSKRAGGLIPRIALDQCRVPERYRTRVSFCPRSSNTEQARPKRQVAGESPAGDTIFAGVVQQQNAAVPRPRRRCDSVHPLQLLSLWCSPVNTPASHAGDHRSEAGQGRQFMPPKHFQRCVRSVSESARCNSEWGLQFWASG
jgi:hypothetical protein